MLSSEFVVDFLLVQMYLSSNALITTMTQLQLFPPATDPSLVQETRELFQHEGSTEELVQRILAAAKALESLNDKPTR